jgi:hypothetical protein
MLKSAIIFSFLLISLTSFISGNGLKKEFDKADFYAALSSDKLNEINTQLNILKESSLDEKEAYEGTLLMKKSGLVANAKEKLSLFKTGRMKLESSISKDAKNAEYRFLRIIIQEHAPKIVKYRNELEADSRLILDNYKNLPQFLQQVINDYSKKSKVLKNL